MEIKEVVEIRVEKDEVEVICGKDEENIRSRRNLE